VVREELVEIRARKRTNWAKPVLTGLLLAALVLAILQRLGGLTPLAG